MQSALFGKNFITTADWSNNEIESFLDVAGDPELGFLGFCANSAYSAGIAGVPTIGFGPETDPDAHTVNERMKVRNISKAPDGHLGIFQAVLNSMPCSILER